MCTAYNIGKNKAKFPKWLKQKTREKLDRIKQAQLIRPTLEAPVILSDGECETMRWGFFREFSNAVVNAREDKLDSSMWKEALEKRRCLIPATAYYEWSGSTGHKRTHRFSSPNETWLWIAGIWEIHAKHGYCFSMITTQPTGVVQGIHTRMPAILSPGEISPYLQGTIRSFEPAAELLQVTDSANPLRKGQPEQIELF
ncbi:MAG: SOS response-associated peptidase [Akkermansiaceae bacterium]